MAASTCYLDGIARDEDGPRWATGWRRGTQAAGKIEHSASEPVLVIRGERAGAIGYDDEPTGGDGG